MEAEAKFVKNTLRTPRKTLKGEGGHTMIVGHSLGGADDVERLRDSGGGMLGMLRTNNEWFDEWSERNGVDTCWVWVEAMHVNQELIIGVEYYKFMGEMEGGMKIFRPPKRNDVNCQTRPPF